MRIGIDIDDTISKTNEKLIVEALKYDKEHVRGKGFKNKNAYSFMEMFYWTVMDVDQFLDSVRNSKFFLELEVKGEADKYIPKLYEEGHEIYFITKRKDCFKVKRSTKKWLKNHGIPFHKLFLSSSKKGQLCNDLNIDLFIDNDIKNIYDALDFGIDSLLMGDEYNKDETELRRVESWQEIYNYVSGVK